MAAAFYLPYNPTFNSNSTPEPLARVYFYAPGTTTKMPIYADSGLTEIQPNPVQSNAAARLPAIYFPEDQNYRVVIRNKLGVIMEEMDPFVPGSYPQGPKGDSGAAGNVASDIAALAAYQPSADAVIYAPDGATFTWTLGNFTGLADDINIVKQDDTALTVGAWVRQAATSISFGAGNVADALPNIYNMPRSLADAVVQTNGTITTGTDCAAEFNRLKALGVAAGGAFSIVFPAGQYITYSSLTSADDMTVVLNDATVFGLPATPTGGLGHQKLSVFTMAGTEPGSPEIGTGDYFETTPRALAANTNLPVGSQQFVAAGSVADLAPGDWVHIAQGWGGWHGITSEYVQVASVAGSTVGFTTPLRYSYSNQPSSLADFVQKHILTRPAPGVGAMFNWPIAGFRKVTPRRNAHIIGTGNARVTNLSPEVPGYAVFAIFGWAAIGCSVEGVTIGGGGKWWLDCQSVTERSVSVTARYSSASVPSASQNAWLYNGSNNVLVDRPKMEGANLDIEEYPADMRITSPRIRAGLLYIHCGARSIIVDGKGSVENASVGLQIGSADFVPGVQALNISGLDIAAQGAAVVSSTAKLLDTHPSIDPAAIPAVMRFYSGGEIALTDCEAVSTANPGSEMLLTQPIRARDLRIGQSIGANIVKPGGAPTWLMGTARRAFDGKRVGLPTFTGALPTFYAELDTVAYNLTAGTKTVIFERRATPLGGSATFVIVDGIDNNGGVVVGDVARFLIATGNTTITTPYAVTGGSPVVTVPSTTGMVAGMAITGEQTIPMGTTVLSVDSATQLTMSANAVYTLTLDRFAQATVGHIKRELEVPVTAVNLESSFFEYGGGLPAGFSVYSGTGAYVDFCRWA